MLDLLIVKGLIIDGTGNPGFYAGVGIEDNKIRILRGDLSLVEAKRTIDASGMIVCPGFIDVHAHSGLVILAEPKHEAKVRQGVTTELIGVDGNSYAPFFDRDDFLRFVEMNAGLDGNPDLNQEWSSVAEYLMCFDNKVAINIAYIIGNSPLRIATVGWDNKPADSKQISNMKALLREGMEEGAFGLSTGLDYPPGSYADTGELIELSHEAALLGGIYHTHTRNTLGDQFLDPVKEAIEIGMKSGIPCHITHLYHRVGHPGGGMELLGLVEGARDHGQDVTFDCYPYLYGSTRLTILFPQWSQDGGPEKFKEVLASDEGRARLKMDMFTRGTSYQDMWLTYFKREHNHKFEGKSIAEAAIISMKSEVDTMCDLLLDEDLQVSFVMAGVNGKTLPQFVTHPMSMVGSDALLIGEFPSPRTYGTFPTILAEYVREERKMNLPEAIRKMTSFPAQRLGILNRGTLKDNMLADLVIFDPERVSAPATRTDPKQFATGIDYVVVNGSIVIDHGIHTGVLAGKTIRRGRNHD